MTAYEPDQEVIRWGLNFLDCSFFNSHYGGDNIHQEAPIYNEQYDSGQYMRDYHYDTQSNYIESDEVLAQALQDQMSQLAVSEAAEPPHAEGMHVLPYNVASYWLPPPPTNYYSEYTTRYSGEDEADDSMPSSSCSSPGEILCDGEDYSYSLELTDEYDLDGELGKRLTQMVPVPHVPRINGEIPSIDEATSDHQRLLDRLQLYDLIERKVQGDGNCQFRALSDQFYRSHEHHKFVRRQVVSQLRSHPEFYEGYVPMEYGEYLKKMSKSGEWGDHVTLQAAADSYGVKIFVITSFKDTCYIEILPKDQKSKRVIFLSFWAEVHYNSIYPQGEMPPSEMKRKKKWWLFGHQH